MKPPVVDDRSQFVEVIQKKSSASSTTDGGGGNEEGAKKSTSPLSLSSLEQEMNKMWNTAIGSAAAATAAAPPTEPALENEETNIIASSCKSDKSHPDNMNNHEEKKDDDVSDEGFSLRPAAVDARETDEVLEEGLEAMWVEEIVSATPKAEAAAEPLVPGSSPPPPLGSNKNGDDNNNNNNNTHTGRLRKSFFGKKKKVDSSTAQVGVVAGNVVVKEEDAVVRQSLMMKMVKKPTKVQTSIRLLENEPELQLPKHVATSARAVAAAATADVKQTATTSTPTTAVAVAAVTALETPMSRKTIFTTGGTTSIDTNLLKEAALKAFTARKLLAQALSIKPNAADNGGKSREALAQSAFREATHARKMVESGNSKGEGTLPKGLDVILRDATDKGAEAVAMMQKQLRNAAACKAADDDNGCDDDVLPARSIEEHADRARHYLDLILPDAPGMTQAQARTAAAASSGAAPGDEVSSLGFDNTVSEEGGGGETGDPMNLLSMSSLNEILDGPIDPDDSPIKHSLPAALSPKSPTVKEEEKKKDDGGVAAAADVPVSSSTAKKENDSPDISIAADAAAAVPSNNNKNLEQPDDAVPTVNKKDNKDTAQQAAEAGNSGAAVQPDTHKSKKAAKKSAKKKERKSNTTKKSGFFGRFRACQAPNLSSSSSGQSSGLQASSTTETGESINQEKIKKSRARKAARDAIRSKRFLASVTIDDGQDDEEEPEPEELAKVHHRIRDMDDRMLKKLNDAIQADCDESVTSYDGIKMHGAPVLEVAKNDNNKKKSKVNKSKGVEKIAPVVEVPAPKPSRISSMRQTSFIPAPAGSPSILAQASWNSLLQHKTVKQEAAPDVAVPSSSEGTSNQDEEAEEVGPISSSSASSSQRLDPPQLNQEQQALRNVISKSPDSTMSHGDKYSVDQEDTMEQTSEEQGDLAVVENDEPKEDRYLVLPADFNTFEAFLQSCGSEMDTLCGVAAKTDDATRQVLLQDLPSSTELPPLDSVVPSEGLAVERGVDEKMTVETDPAALANEPRDITNNNRMKNILSRLSTKKSNNELNTTKSLLSSKSSRSKNGQASSRKGLLGFFNNMSSSKKEVIHGNTAKTPNMDSNVDRQLPPLKQAAAQAPVATPEMPSKEAQLDIPAESLSNEQEMDRQLSLPLSNELGTSSESTTNELPSMDKYSNANDDGPKMEAKATTVTTPSKTKSDTPASKEKVDKPNLEAPTKATKLKELSHKEKQGESKVSTPKKGAIAKVSSSNEKRNPKKDSKAKGLLLKPARVPPKKEAKESNKGSLKKEAKEKHKTQKGETRNTKEKVKKQTLPSAKEVSKSRSQVVVQVVEKQRAETPKESNDGTPFQNSSNIPPDETIVAEQPLAASTSQAGPHVASTKTEGAVQAPTQLPPEKKILAKKKSKKTPVPTSTEVPKSNSDTENKEDPLIALIREQSFRQSKKSRDPMSVDESDPPRGIDP